MAIIPGSLKISAKQRKVYHINVIGEKFTRNVKAGVILIAVLIFNELSDRPLPGMVKVFSYILMISF